MRFRNFFDNFNYLWVYFSESFSIHLECFMCLELIVYEDNFKRRLKIYCQEKIKKSLEKQSKIQTKWRNFYRTYKKLLFYLYKKIKLIDQSTTNKKRKVIIINILYFKIINYYLEVWWRKSLFHSSIKRHLNLSKDLFNLDCVGEWHRSVFLYFCLFEKFRQSDFNLQRIFPLLKIMPCLFLLRLFSSGVKEKSLLSRISL